jgi:hypothetical protein
VGPVERGDNNAAVLALSDFYPEACMAHDQCYATPGKTRLQCDNQFWTDMLTESGPWPNVLVPTFYWLGVRFGGAEAYGRAQDQ